MHTVKFHGGPRDGMMLHILQLPSRFRVPMPPVDHLREEPDLRIAEYELCTDPHSGIVSYVYVRLTA